MLPSCLRSPTCPQLYQAKLVDGFFADEGSVGSPPFFETLQKLLQSLFFQVLEVLHLQLPIIRVKSYHHCPAKPSNKQITQSITHHQAETEFKLSSTSRTPLSSWYFLASYSHRFRVEVHLASRAFLEGCQSSRLFQSQLRQTVT